MAFGTYVLPLHGRSIACARADSIGEVRMPPSHPHVVGRALVTVCGLASSPNVTVVEKETAARAAFAVVDRFGYL